MTQDEERQLGQSVVSDDGLVIEVPKDEDDVAAAEPLGFFEREWRERTRLEEGLRHYDNLYLRGLDDVQNDVDDWFAGEDPLTRKTEVAAAINMGSVAWQEGLDAEHLERIWPTYRDILGRSKYKLANLGEVPLFELLQKEAEIRQGRREAEEMLPNEVVAHVLEDTRMRTARNFDLIQDNIKHRYGTFMDEDLERKMRLNGLQLLTLVRHDSSTVRETAARGWDVLARFSNGRAEGQELIEFAKALNTLPAARQERALAYIAMAARARRIDIKGYDRYAVNLGQNVLRGFDYLPSLGLSTLEGTIQGLIDAANEDRLIWREADGRLVVPWHEDWPGYRKPSSEERKKILADLNEDLTAVRTVRKLRAVAARDVDPILPILPEGTFGGTMERGSYMLGGSVGTMAVTAIPHAGPFLGYVAISENTYNELVLENPNLDPAAARSMANASALLQVPLEFLKLKVIAGRLPMFGKWLKGMKPGMGKAATGTLLSITELNLQEGGQDLVAAYVPALVAAIREDMPDQDLGAIFDVWMKERPVVLASTLIPGLVGGGVLKFRELADEGRSVLHPVVMRRVGFSDEQIKAIHAAENPEAEFQRQFPLRTEENIRKGIALIYADEAKMGNAEKLPREETSEVGPAGDKTVVNQIEKPAAESIKQSKGYPGPLEIRKGSGLLPEQSKVEARFAAWVQADPDRALNEYSKIPGSENGRVIDMDLMRELSPEYSKNKLSRAIHASSVQSVVGTLVTQKIIPEKISKLQPGNIVGLTAGGPGSGKSVIKANWLGEWNRAKFIWDGVLRNFSFAKSIIELAKRKKSSVIIWYVHCPVEKATQQAMTRSENTGRTVPLEILWSGHYESQKAIIKLLEFYLDDPDVRIKVIDNSGNLPKVVDEPLTFLREKNIIYKNEKEVERRVRESFEESAGIISDPKTREFFRRGSQ